jgi:hypothetical protein
LFEHETVEQVGIVEKVDLPEWMFHEFENVGKLKIVENL